MFKLEAINELLLTVPVLVKKTPLGFTKITCPLELICPAILDGVDPRTLFSEEEFDEGHVEVTLPPLCTEKEFQLITDLVVVWSICR